MASVPPTGYEPRQPSDQGGGEMREWVVSLMLATTACHGEPESPPAPHPAPQAPAATSLPHHVYVWQRVWTPSVQAAVDAAAADFTDRVVLAVESDGEYTVWSGLWTLDGQPRRNPTADWVPDAERALGDVSLALRWSNADRALQPGVVQAQIDRVLRRAAQRGWTVRAVHLDADIPTARLSEWAAVLAAVKTATPVDVAVLTLVDHVDKPGWKALTQAVDTVVLQVHSVPLPGADRPVLFDPSTASRAVGAAVASSASPVQVALPTHTLTDARTGGAVRAEPAVLVDWLAAGSNPALQGLAGVVWFRLPVDGAADTWTPAALADVRAGTVPDSVATLSLAPPPPAWGAADATRAVYVTSTGRDHAWLPAVDVCVPEGRLAVVPMDLRYQDRPAGAECVVLEPRTDQLLAPDEQVAVALVLADVPVEVRRHGASTGASQ